MLNALRHQRFDHAAHLIFGGNAATCSTPYGIRGLITGHKIVNRDLRDSCSMPYGIRGLITLQSNGTNPRIDMLNALRHERFDHSANQPIA